FIKRGEEEEHEYNGNCKDESRAASCGDLFTAHTTELVAVSCRQYFCRNFTHGIDRLTTTISGSCCSRYFRRAVNVVVRNECRRFNNLRGDQRAEGHHSTCAVTHVILANFSDVLSERSVCLRHYSEVTSIEVEVVYITAAQVTRKR